MATIRHKTLQYVFVGAPKPVVNIVVPNFETGIFGQSLDTCPISPHTELDLRLTATVLVMTLSATIGTAALALGRLATRFRVPLKSGTLLLLVTPRSEWPLAFLVPPLLTPLHQC